MLRHERDVDMYLEDGYKAVNSLACRRDDLLDEVESVPVESGMDHAVYQVNPRVDHVGVTQGLNPLHVSVHTAVLVKAKKLGNLWTK